ncbi:hypothetical protein FQV26_04570 [Planococcus sp. CPCC 101016]|uniref:hypothetical protein n=1 Tax=Planococcus sp. CPCC 101016 TaxID=2599617 RepID=UPI0011B7ADEA|nr:hypothetical protein [Planococcus sp. CPCC 101016]TWT07091.1 hypothetical protein FQV26_04570 [Planococcus sp. CPCC 101016]
MKTNFIAGICYVNELNLACQEVLLPERGFIRLEMILKISELSVNYDKLSIDSPDSHMFKITRMGGLAMADGIHKILEERGIQVPEAHQQMLAQQMQAVQQLRETVDNSQLKDFDMALTHVPGGERP